MIKRYSIEFYEADQPITGAVTKFGGAPGWLAEPEWPISRQTGKPMRFIGQVALDRVLFPDVPPRMAYLFMTDHEVDGQYVDGQWEPDGGENALILQPGSSLAPTQAVLTGPTLLRFVEADSDVVEVAGEYGVELRLGEDPEFIGEEQLQGWTSEALDEYAEALAGNKIGGTPGFIQGSEFPGDGEWILILQLDSAQVPFYVNFGDAGVGYAFMSTDGTVGKFLWQCA